MPNSGNERVEPFAYNQRPFSIFRQLGHCIAPFILNAEPMQSDHIVRPKRVKISVNIEQIKKTNRLLRLFCSIKRYYNI